MEGRVILSWKKACRQLLVRSIPPPSSCPPLLLRFVLEFLLQLLALAWPRGRLDPVSAPCPAWHRYSSPYTYPGIDRPDTIVRPHLCSERARALRRRFGLMLFSAYPILYSLRLHPYRQCGSCLSCRSPRSHRQRERIAQRLRRVARADINADLRALGDRIVRLERLLLEYAAGGCS